MDFSKMMNWKYIALFFVLLLVVLVVANYATDYFFMKQMEKKAAKQVKSAEQIAEEEADKVPAQTKFA